MSRILIPEYLLNFARDIYEGPLPSNFGERLIESKYVIVLENWYKLFGGVIPTNQGKRMVPNYLALFIQNLANADILEVVDDNIAYIKETPQNALKYAFINKVGGMSYKSENLCPTATYNDIMNNTVAKSIDLGNLPLGTYTISFNVLANADNRTFIGYYVNNGVVDGEHNINTSLSGTGQKSYTFTLDGTIPYDDIRFGINSGSLNYNIELENLMLNIGSTGLPYKPYFEGIRDSAVTSINDYIIPSEIRALDGYGWGINSSLYNYIDWINKKFVQKVRKITFTGANSEVWGVTTNQRFYITLSGFSSPDINVVANLFCDKLRSVSKNQMGISNDYAISGGDLGSTAIYVRIDSTYTTAEQLKAWLNNNPITIYYELVTPVETDISSYIGDNIIDVSNVLTFNNEYEQAVPSEITYYVRS